jgi:glycosyltransferase involved in cell wall biosynthesis
MIPPKVSVVVVNYNQGRFLPGAVDSILGQAFNDIEVIIVDDGSRDGSINIIQDLVTKYPGKLQFHYHPNHRNLGISRTYALGISKTKSPYIAFLEADDCWGKSYLGPKVDLLDHYPEAGVAFSRYKILSRGLYGLDMVVRQHILGLSMPRGVPFDNLKGLIKKNNVATFSAFVTRKSLLNQISLTVSPELLYFDWWILFQLAMRSKFILDRSAFVYWRQYPDSTLGSKSLERHKSLLCHFMQVMYEEIGGRLSQLSESNKSAYLKNRSILPEFISFYQNPDVLHFLAFFRYSPVWAVDSLASYFINHWKYSR